MAPIRPQLRPNHADLDILSGPQVMVSDWRPRPLHAADPTLCVCAGPICYYCNPLKGQDCPVKPVDMGAKYLLCWVGETTGASSGVGPAPVKPRSSRTLRFWYLPRLQPHFLGKVFLGGQRRPPLVVLEAAGGRAGPRPICAVTQPNAAPAGKKVTRFCWYSAALHFLAGRSMTERPLEPEMMSPLGVGRRVLPRHAE